MKVSANRLKYLLLYMGLVFYFIPAVAQEKNSSFIHQFKNFNKELEEANLSFTLPNGFKEIRPGNIEDASFDYAISLPDADFEIWFQVRSQKENWGYGKSKNDKARATPNQDSLYQEIASAQAEEFMGNKNYMTRNIPQYSLARYNADEGKTYLLNLPDSPTTRHYKYAMLVVLQKNHTGLLLAVCFANELGPGFFKNLNMASSCIKFNP
jgi:hypothetical protein